MSTPEQPLTRKQLRELQRTGAVPVAEEPAAEDPVTEEPAAEVPEVEVPVQEPNLPREAKPAVIAPAPPRDADVDLGVAPLTRRQARQQEQIRTASIPVVSPDLGERASAPVETAEPKVVEPEAAAEPEVVEPEVVEPVISEPEAAEADDVEPEESDADVSAPEGADPDEDTDTDPDEEADAQENAPNPVTVGAQFGADILEAEEVAPVELPPSFDELIARNASTTSTLTTPSALILSQTPSAPPLGGPVNATGEVILTGSYQLPERLSTSGHDPRTTDGKDVDAVLVDKELPASSSPMPIAASAAISTVRGNDEIIRPPAPEKSNRWIFTLAITAGVLAIAVVGLVIVAVMNGAF